VRPREFQRNDTVVFRPGQQYRAADIGQNGPQALLGSRETLPRLDQYWRSLIGRADDSVALGMRGLLDQYRSVVLFERRGVRRIAAGAAFEQLHIFFHI